MRTALLLLALSSFPGCGIYFLDPDPRELPLDAPAPEFTLERAFGQPLGLAELREQGNPVLVFYRGHW